MMNLDRALAGLRSQGYANLGTVLNGEECRRLLESIHAVQTFSPAMFLDEADFLANPQYKDVNPKPGRNLLERFEPQVHQLEQDQSLLAFLTSMLGDSYYVLNKKIICGVPESWLPPWLRVRLQNNPVNNLGAYVKPEYRHVTYFYGIDFHQDIIDWPNREPDFLTVYVYLHDVGPHDAPLYVLPASHSLGIDTFPHKLTRVQNEPPRWQYINSSTGAELVADQLMLTGKAGTVASWHSFIMHGTQPNEHDRARISLRYLIAKNPESKGAVLDEINRNIGGKLQDSEVRNDLAANGAPTVKSNYLYTQYKNSGSK